MPDWLQLVFLSTGVCAWAAPAAAAPHYHVAGRISSTDSRWDYAAVDAERARMYLGRAGGVLAVDLQTNTVTAQLVASGLVHGVLPLDAGVVAMAESTINSVAFFDAGSGSIIARTFTGKPPAAGGWHNPDALAFAPDRGILAAVNGDSGTVVLIDVQSHLAVGQVDVGGKLEFAAANANGQLYVNVASANQIAVIDIGARKVVRRIDLKGCEEPTGLAYDAADGLIMSVCSNGVVKFVAEGEGGEIASVHVGAGADALIYDPVRGLVFSPGGDVGTLSVIKVQGRGHIALAQTVITQRGARLGAVDPRTGRVYLPVARFRRPAQPGLLPALVPGSFEIMILEP